MASFWTFNHATSITGIPEAEIIAAGERGEFARLNFPELEGAPATSGVRP
jgi:hypothetical protein